MITFAAGRPGTGECANLRHPEMRCRYDFLVVRRGPLAYQKYLHTYSQDFRSTFGYVVVGILVRLMCHFLVWFGGDSFPVFPCQIRDSTGQTAVGVYSGGSIPERRRYISSVNTLIYIPTRRLRRRAQHHMVCLGDSSARVY